MRLRPLRTPCVAALLLAAGCETPAPTPTDATTGADRPDAADAAEAPPDAGARDTGTIAPDSTTDAPGADATVTCTPLPSDYTPRTSVSSTDTWPACVADRGAWVRFDTSTSSIARVEAYERINLDPTNGRTAALFDPARDPSPAEFTAARAIYLESEGLESRVSRRSDEHYPQPSPNDCRLADVRTAHPDYCAGPVHLAPILNDSFRDGQLGTTGTPQRVLAARVQAALLWFLYLSPYKESLTCTTTPADCDSAWAYYAGGVLTPDETQPGLARLVRAAEPATHARIWDGLLAVRCWRGLDPTVPATDAMLRDRARTQLDRALTRGIVAVLQARLRAMATAPDDVAQAHLAFVQVLGPRLDRALRAQDPDTADRLRRTFAALVPTGVDVAATVAMLDRLLPCP